MEITRDYTDLPDKWIILSLPGNLHKIFASWNNNTWQVNSGIKEVQEKDDFYYFIGFSGSVYKCHKEQYGVVALYNKLVLERILNLSEGKLQKVSEENISEILEKYKK